jgi:hypothetical protein
VAAIHHLALKILVSVFCAVNLSKVDKEQLVLGVVQAGQNGLFAFRGFPLFIRLNETDTIEIKS